MTVAVKILGYDDGVRLPFHGGGGAGGIGGVKGVSGGTGGNRREQAEQVVQLLGAFLSVELGGGRAEEWAVFPSDLR